MKRVSNSNYVPLFKTTPTLSEPLPVSTRASPSPQLEKRAYFNRLWVKRCGLRVETSSE
jgi:hypothetical protein